jgi:hypothetical protein
MPSFFCRLFTWRLAWLGLHRRAPARRLTCLPPVAQSTAMATSTHLPSSPPAGPKSTAAHTGELARKEATTQAPPQAPQKATREQDEDDDDEEEEDDHEAAIDGRGRQVMEVEGAEAPGSSGRGRKRQRKTAEQVSVLEAHFSANPLPDKALRDRLGVQLGLTTRQVQIWFQNKVPHPTPPHPRLHCPPLASSRLIRPDAQRAKAKQDQQPLQPPPQPTGPAALLPAVRSSPCARSFYSTALTLRPSPFALHPRRGPSCRRVCSPGQLRGLLASLPPASGSVRISPPPL